MKEKKVRYKTKTITTGFSGRSRKMERLIAKGWEVVTTTRYGYSSNKVVLRRQK